MFRDALLMHYYALLIIQIRNNVSCLYCCTNLSLGTLYYKQLTHTQIQTRTKDRTNTYKTRRTINLTEEQDLRPLIPPEYHYRIR